MISVLCVDDEPGFLELVKEFLETDKEFSIDVSASAQEALKSLNLQSYDSIVSDYQMPGMDGIAFLKAVRQRFGDIPFILFTGRSRDEIVIEAIGSGVDFYLRKGGDPVAQFAELAHVIRMVAGRRRAGEERFRGTGVPTGITGSGQPEGAGLWPDGAARDVPGDHGVRAQDPAVPQTSGDRPFLQPASAPAPGGDTGDPDLTGILDIAEVRALMEDFTRLTGMVTAIVDRKGVVIEDSGWQDICTKFHRVNKETARFCTESDLCLSGNLKPGEYMANRCKNHLWDVATPLYIGDIHAGTIFTGQFFYDYEDVDEDFFAERADEYGFDRAEYLSALRRVPRYSRQQVRCLMDFLVKLTGLVSRLSYSNLKLAESMAEEVRIKEALIRSERRLSGIIGHLPDATFAIDNTGRVIAWNNAMVEMSGVPSENVLGKGDHEYSVSIYGSRRPVLVDWIFSPQKEPGKEYRVLKREGDAIVVEADVVLPGGRSVVLWGKATALYDSDGNMTGAIESIRDITEHKKAEAELRNLSRELEQRVALRTAELSQAQAAFRRANEKLNLLSGITRHDIKNQLLILSGYLEVSKRSLDDPERTAEFIAKERKIADTIARQISFTKDYEDLGVKAPAWQGVASVVRSAGAGLPAGDIRIEAGDPDLEIYADPLLEKVFYNLIDNALRYGGAGMTRIRISHQLAGEELIIAVEDDGEGIRQEDKSRLFTKGFGRHTGLGLYLSREILSITGIGITEDGEPGKGARFAITVPEGEFRFTDGQSVPGTGDGCQAIGR